LLDRGGQPFDGAGSLPGVPAAGPIAAATFEPGDATSCFASHASLAASSLESAAHAYSVPSLHISAIEISSEPYAGASSAAAAAAAFGAFEGACSCLESHAAFPALAESICCCGGAPCGGARCGGPCCDGGAFASGASIAATFEPGDATSCFASHANLAASSLESAAHAYSVPSLHISAIEISSEPYAGASAAAAAAAAFGAFEGACSCLESRTALPASEGGDAGSGVGGGGGVDKALPAAAGAADRGAAPCSTSESNAAASCFASHVSTFFLFSSVASAALSFVCSSSSRVTLPPPFASPFSARSPCFISP
jgi:hypothetical protein